VNKKRKREEMKETRKSWRKEVVQEQLNAA
jgi:hypothetical protein